MRHPHQIVHSSLIKQLKLIGYALREAFISLIPFLIVSSISTLILAAVLQFHLYANVENIKSGIQVLQNALPIMVLVSFTHQLARLKGIDKMAAVALSLSLLISLQPFNSTTLFGTNSSFLALLIPILSTFLLAKIANNARFISPKYTALDDNLRMVYRYSPAFVISYILLLGVFILLQNGFQHVHQSLMVGLGTFANSTEAMLFLRTIVSHLLTFIGVHGTNIFDLLVNPSYLKSPLTEHFSAKNLIDTFVIFGGVGSCLALAISILLQAKDQHAIKISKISMPFLVFNISEILLYGLPIVFNKKLFTPFIVVPIINLSLALLLMHYVPIEFNAITLPWTTPLFINAYLATSGNWLVVLFQLFLLGLDILIYMFFVRDYVRTQSSSEHFSLLSNKLNISSSIQSKRGLKFQEAQTFLVNAHVDTDDIIQLIIKNELTMYYQPIVQVRQQRCHHFEALLRLRKTDGTIVNPDFLPTLENAGLSSVIDIWVCRKVRSDILAWQAEGYNPLVSVNIHPDTFLDDEVMQQIFSLLDGFNVQFELVERAFFNSDASSGVIRLLQKMQFKLAIDDFGTGYSTLQSLHTTAADTIKFDKQLLDVTNTDKGYKIYHYASQMCNDLGFNIVAEGVESEAQLNIIQQSGVQNAQGWYFSEALPPTQAKQFAQSFGLKLP
jgi:lactose/cellobiose-specific phosphotransferase system IIC component